MKKEKINIMQKYLFLILLVAIFRNNSFSSNQETLKLIKKELTSLNNVRSYK